MSAILVDDKLKCANPLCDGLLQNGAHRCSRCGEAQFYCSACGATARSLARFCRCCGAPLNADWALEHQGLSYRPSRRVAVNVGTIFRIGWQLSLGAEMVAAPLAARGIIVLTLTDGRIVIVDEVDGRVRAELSAPAPLSFTPVITENLLVAATSDGIIAFDLIAALYGSMAKGGVKTWHMPLAPQEQVTKPLLASSEAILAVVKQPARLQLALIDKKTGARRANLPLEGRPAKTTAPYLKEKGLFIAAKDGTIMLIDVARAEVRATARLGREVDINVLPCGRASSVLFVLADGQLWSVSMAEQSLQLQPFGDTGGLIINAVAATEKYVAVAHGSGLALYDPFGALLWETALDANSLVTAPLIESDLAWVIDDSGMMFFFDLSASVPKLRQRVFEHTVALPAILTSNQLILSSRAGQVKAYRWNCGL